MKVKAPLRHLLAASIALSLLALAACTASGGATSKNTVTVTIKDLKFMPPTVSIQRGTSVRWVNKDTTAHTSTSADFDPEAKSNPPGSWNSPVLDPGESWTRKFDQVGSFDYACSIHPYIKGKVEVK